MLILLNFWIMVFLCCNERYVKKLRLQHLFRGMTLKVNNVFVYLKSSSERSMMQKSKCDGMRLTTKNNPHNSMCLEIKTRSM